MSPFSLRRSSEWIVDADGYYNVAEKRSFKKLLSAASSGAYNGACRTVVAGDVTGMSTEGNEQCALFHEHLREDKREHALSADLWSKNGFALLGGFAAWYPSSWWG